MGVKNLKVGDLEIEFHSNFSGQESWDEPKGVVAPARAIKAQEAVEKKSLLQEDFDRRQIELDELLLSDPAEYERQVLAGELDGTEKEEAIV